MLQIVVAAVVEVEVEVALVKVVVARGQDLVWWAGAGP